MAPRSSSLFRLIRRRPSALAVAGAAAIATDSASAVPGTTTGLALEFGLAYLPHPDKLAKGGEDAHFYSHACNAFGVADGVGAWSTMGIDPARFSRKLMHLSEHALLTDSEADPVTALRSAYDGVRRLGLPGSCTALIGVLRRDTLHLANLGDSGAMILSTESATDSEQPDLSKLSLARYRIAFRTTEQLHRFNCPFQLGPESTDSPESATVTQHGVRVGDLIVAGSDGLWDNLFDADVQRLAGEYDNDDDVTELAYVIATAAAARAAKRRGPRATPFAVDAAEAGVPFEGGKMDDITVLVARVVPAPEPCSTARARL